MRLKIGYLDLIGVEFHPIAASIQDFYPFNFGLLVIHENFHVIPIDQIEINLVIVVPYGHYESAILVQQGDLLIQA